MPNKMERFTNSSRRALRLAQDEAESVQSKVIGTEHMLLGIMREESAEASKILRGSGLEFDQLKKLVEKLTKESTDPSRVELVLSKRTKKALQFAVDEAISFGHSYVGTEHLLLGVIRQADYVVIEVFDQLSIDMDEVTRLTRQVLNRAPGTIKTEAAVRPGLRQLISAMLQRLRHILNPTLQVTPTKSTIPAWEYQVMFIQKNGGNDKDALTPVARPDRYTDKLNTYAQAGWELVSFHRTDDGARAVLKRHPQH